MNKKLLLLSILLISITGSAQTYLDSTINSAMKRVLFANPNEFSIGSYGEAHYNQSIHENNFSNGNIDLHRVIVYMGYKFNDRLQFFSETEFEHVKEVYVEQAFMNYTYNSFLNFKAGVILIPMGFVNEFHEPTLFNGVERPNVDKYIIPSTWSEMGFGMHGLFKRANLKYQIYAVNGFKGYDGSAKINGGGLRSARQKGAEALIRTPSITGKLTFFGLNGLRLGLSGYYGSTESSMYNGLDRENQAAIDQADSSRVGVAMTAFNMQYTLGKFQVTAVGNYTTLSNTEAYNTFTGSNAAKAIYGYYGELAYRQNVKRNKDYPQVIPFVRYENYDTQYKVDDNIVKNDAYHREELTFGVGYQMTPGTIVKADYQWVKNGSNARPFNVLNVGFGFWF